MSITLLIKNQKVLERKRHTDTHRNDAILHLTKMKSQKYKGNLLLIFFDFEVETNLIDIILYHWNILTHLLLQQFPMFCTTCFSAADLRRPSPL